MSAKITEAKESAFAATGRNVLETEAKALLLAGERLDGAFSQAVELILQHQGKVVIVGIGKSGHVGQKIVATLCSTGTPAVFLHAAEAIHGDLGIYSPGDPTILISKSGTTAEIIRLIPMLREFKSPLISFVGNANSPIAKQVDIVIDASVPDEADPLHVVPTTSAVLAMALGDALASALMEARGFETGDFARLHPGGQLGRNLNLRVSDVMHSYEKVAIVSEQASLRDVVIAMTQFPLGAAIVGDEAGRIVGLITDGDVRRILQVHDDIREICALEIMTHSPMSIVPDALVGDAVQMMENRPRQISVLPVRDKNSLRCLGLIRIHDAYQPWG